MKAVNLLPPELRASRRSSPPNRKSSPAKPLPLGALLVLGALGALVVAVAALTLAGNTVTDRENRLSALKVQEQAANAQITRLQAYGTFRQLTADHVSTVRKLADSRFDWEQALRDLSRAIPGNVTLSGLTATVAAGARAGAAASSNPLRSARAAPAIEMSGCTRDHGSVARLLARMRAVRGVTRVALARSAKAEDAASGSTDSADGAAPSGCGRDSTSEFEVVIFFEDAAGTATATPGAAGAATATPSPTATPSASATATSSPVPQGSPTPTAEPGASSTPTPDGQGGGG